MNVLSPVNGPRTEKPHGTCQIVHRVTVLFYVSTNNPDSCPNALVMRVPVSVSGNETASCQCRCEKIATQCQIQAPSASLEQKP